MRHKLQMSICTGNVMCTGNQIKDKPTQHKQHEDPRWQHAIYETGISAKLINEGASRSVDYGLDECDNTSMMWENPNSAVRRIQ